MLVYLKAGEGTRHAEAIGAGRGCVFTLRMTGRLANPSRDVLDMGMVRDSLKFEPLSYAPER